MDAAPDPRRPPTLANLIDALDNYISGNRHSHDVDERWLCSELDPVLALVREVRTRVSPENKRKVNEFRAREIEKELEKKRHDLDTLERDLATIRKQASA